LANAAKRGASHGHRQDAQKMQKKQLKIERAVLEICSRTDTQTHGHGAELQYKAGRTTQHSTPLDDCSNTAQTQSYNESAQMQLEHCWFPGLAISNAKILIHFSSKIYGSNFIKQHSENVMV